MLGSDGQLFKSLPLKLLSQFGSVKLKEGPVERAFDRYFPEADNTHEKALLPVLQFWDQRGWQLFWCEGQPDQQLRVEQQLEAARKAIQAAGAVALLLGVTPAC